MIDALTGLPDIVGLFDTVHGMAGRKEAPSFSLAAIQLTALWQVNRTQGREAGDGLLKQTGQVLRELQPGSVFRAGGDKFVVFLDSSDRSTNTRRAQILAGAVDPPTANPTLCAPRLGVLHFDRAKEMTPGRVLACLAVALSDPFHENRADYPVEFEASEICAMREFPWMMVDIAEQLLRLGVACDRSTQLAQTDCVSQLPNSRAAVQEIETCLVAARERGESFSVLLIDGDNLRRFNAVSYAAGDEAIRLIGAALRKQLREVDFLARYRSGDEFLVLLRDLPHDRAINIAWRLCRAVERASRAWLFPTTISIGAVVFPAQGQTVAELLHAAETGLALAKQRGKNQVVSFLEEPVGR